MKHISLTLLLFLCALLSTAQTAQPGNTDSATTTQQAQLLSDDNNEETNTLQTDDSTVAEDETNFYQVLKTKFIEGTPAFMSLVALTLIIGLALCIERLLRLTQLQTDTAPFISRLRKAQAEGNTDEARQLCQAEPHPLAAVALTAINNANSDADTRQQLMLAEANRQTASLEKGCSWISLCIKLAPSLGFLGTVIGMVIAFDRIEAAGDISPTLVAAGMKVALITTIFGIITALILQVFYNIILNKIQRLVSDIEQQAPQLLISPPTKH